MSDQTFLSRVYDCKHRFEQETGLVPTQLFLGPKAYVELKEYVAELNRAGLLFVRGLSVRQIESTLAGMTIIRLMSDGMRAGITAL